VDSVGRGRDVAKTRLNVADSSVEQPFMDQYKKKIDDMTRQAQGW
jgi:hypothetical protein